MKQTAPRIGVGIVGTGFAAKVHLEALRRIPQVELVAVAGHDRRRTEAIATRHGLRAHPDHLALLEDPAVDAVHTCTVNRLHHEVNLAALERDKHVLSEKPLASNGDESARLVATSESARVRGIVSGVCFNYRHYPLVSQIRHLVRGGEYGPPHFVHGHYLQDWLLMTSDWDWRLEEAEKGGGSRAVADIGSHWADLVTYVTGDVITEVLADLGTLHSSRLRPTPNGAAVDASRSGVEPVAVQSEDFGTVLVRFDRGSRGAFTVSQTSAGCKNGLSFQVDCAQAAFAWHQEQPDRAWVGRRDQPNLELVRDPATVSSQRAGGYLPAGHPQGWLDALCSLFTDFYAAVSARQAGREYDTGIASFAEGDALVRLVEAAMRSDRERRWTRIAAARGASV